MDPAKSIESGDYALDDQVGFVMRRATQRHLSIFSSFIKDLTPTQFAALAKLHELGAVSQNDLGRQTAMDSATMKGVVDRLAKRGLVATRRDPDDQRRILVELSLAGHAAYLSNEGAARAITEETLRPLSAPERAQFLALLGRLTG
ncbi:MAG: MarR family transcriptional regulator [Pseudomonadota bacterium]